MVLHRAVATSTILVEKFSYIQIFILTNLTLFSDNNKFSRAIIPHINTLFLNLYLILLVKGIVTKKTDIS
jgi:hypothetical protein